MRPMFEHITFGTFTAIVMGVILCCLACIVITLSCCKKRLPRRSPVSSSGTPYTITERNLLTGSYTAISVIPPPPRYEDLFHYFDSPPPYHARSLLSLAQSKLSSREDLLLHSSPGSQTSLKEEPKVA